MIFVIAVCIMFKNLPLHMDVLLHMLTGYRGQMLMNTKLYDYNKDHTPIYRYSFVFFMLLSH